MSGFLPPVVGILTGSIAGFKAAMAEAKGEMASLEGTAAKTSVMGKTAFLALAAGAAVVAGESVKMASNFQSTMTLIQTQAHASGDEVKYMTKAVLDLAPQVGLAPEKLAEGLYHVESTGLRGKAALDVLKSSAQEAAIGLADFDSVTYAMSGVMSISMKDVKDAADGIAYLNTIVGTGDMRMQDLANAIGTGVLPVFKTAGLGMRDFGAALSTMTDNSMPAQVAANHLRTAVQLMQHQSGPAADALKSIGIQSGQLADDLQKPDGLLVALRDIKTHLEASGKTAAQQGAIISQSFGGSKSSGTVMELLDEIDKLQGKYVAMGTVSQRAKQQQEDWANTQKQFKQQLHEITAQLDVWAIKLGTYLIPKLQTFLGWVRTGAEWLSHHKAVLEVLAVFLGTILFAAFVAATQAAVMFTVALLANPVFDVVIAIGLLGVALYELVKHWKEVVTWLKKAWDSYGWLLLTNPLTAPIYLIIKAIQELVEHWKGFVGTFTHAWDSVAGFFTGLWNDVQKVWNAAWAAIVQPVIDWVKARWAEFEDWWRSHGEEVKQIVNDLWTGIVTVFNTAWGLISGPAQASLDVLKGIYKAGMDVITGVFKVAWDLIKGVFQIAWATIRGVGRLFMDFLKTDFRLFNDVILGIWRTLWQFIGDILATAWQSLLDIFGVFVDLFTGNWGKAWDDVKKFVTDTIGGIVKTITDFATNTITLLYNAGKDLLTGLWNGIMAVWTTVLNIGGYVAETIYNMFRDSVTWLFNAGWNLIVGLWNGIAATGSWIWKYVKGFGESIWHTIEGALGIHSPSTLTFQTGMNVARGLALGIGAHENEAVKAAKAMSANVLAAGQGQLNLGLSANASLPISVGLGGQPVVVQVAIDNAVNLDGKQLQTTQQRRTLRTEARNVNNGLTRYTGR